MTIAADFVSGTRKMFNLCIRSSSEIGTEGFQVECSAGRGVLLVDGCAVLHRVVRAFFFILSKWCRCILS